MDRRLLLELLLRYEADDRMTRHDLVDAIAALAEASSGRELDHTTAPNRPSSAAVQS